MSPSHAKSIRQGFPYRVDPLPNKGGQGFPPEAPQRGAPQFHWVLARSEPGWIGLTTALFSLSKSLISSFLCPSIAPPPAVDRQIRRPWAGNPAAYPAAEAILLASQLNNDRPPPRRS